MTTRELLAALLMDKPLDVKAYVRKASVIPDRTDALDALELLRDAEVPMALVHDEYGHFEGVVTPADILEAIAGVFRSDVDTEEPAAVPRDDGSWLLAGWMPADEMADQLGHHAAGSARVSNCRWLCARTFAAPAGSWRACRGVGMALRGA